LVGFPLDPHNRKNDYAGRLGIGVDITTATHRAMPFWKLHNDPHAPPLPGGCVGLSPNRRFDLTIV